MTPVEQLDKQGQCPECGRPGTIYRVRKGGDERRCCQRCLLGTSPEPDADLPEGTPRLCRAIEELAREIRLARGLVVDMTQREAADGSS